MTRNMALFMGFVSGLLGAFFCAAGLFGLDINTTHANLTVNPEISSDSIEVQVKKTQQKVFDRLVFVVIDALRADMVLGNEAIQHNGEDLSSYMPFTSQLAKSDKSIAYIAHAAVPTVTMPRLKALTTGKKPAFIDVLRNFNSKALEEDNIMKKFHDDGARMVMYGDETWIDLFPNVFHRYDATSGFFTRDIVQVDTNVTRHLVDELDPEYQAPKSKDWDVLILHYLGVDHIGHLEGPHSPLMKVKLAEMDRVVKSVYEAVAQQDSKRSDTALPTLFVLCSDHGMTETGSHGGASVDESSALMMYTAPSNQDNSFPTEYHRALQIDIVPTLASLFGLRIPQGNTGRVLDHVVDRFVTSPESAKKANLHQLLDLAMLKIPPSERNAFKQSLASMKSTSDALTAVQAAVLQSDGSEYNLYYIGIGLVFSVAGLSLSLWKAHVEFRQYQSVYTVLAIGTLVQVASYGSSSAIENEHATWSFLLTSLWMYLGLRHILRKELSRAITILLLAVTTRILRCRNQVINFARLNGMPSLASTTESSIGFEYETNDSISILTTRSILDGLTPSFVNVGSLLLIGMYGVWRANSSVSNLAVRLLLQLSFCSGLVAAGGILLIDRSTNIYAHYVYLMAVGTLFLGLFFCPLKRSRLVAFELSTALLCVALQRESNLPSIVVLYGQQYIFQLWTLGTPHDPFLVTTAGYWMSKCAFYALGNSHLMTTVDFTNAYTGLSSYSQGIVGFFTFFIVMTGPTIITTATAPGVTISLLWTLELLSFTVYSYYVYDAIPLIHLECIRTEGMITAYDNDNLPDVR